MKKKTIFMIGLILTAGMVGLIYLNIYPKDRTPENWPDRDKMEKSLTKKDYDIMVSDVIDINGVALEGERIKASKGKNFVEAFWYKNASDLEAIDQYCSDAYGGASYYRVGNTLYFGTEKALKDAGVVIRKS